jgi:hypothetical protein
MKRLLSIALICTIPVFAQIPQTVMRDKTTGAVTQDVNFTGSFKLNTGTEVDADDDGRVDVAEALNDGTNSATASSVKSLVDLYGSLAKNDGNFIVGNGSIWVVESGVTARDSLGLTIGTHVQAYDATLTSIAALGTGADKLAYTTNVDTWAETALTTFGRSLLDDSDASTARTTLGLAIGTNVQAYDATLLSLASLGTGADKIAYTTNVDTWAEASITTFGRSLIDDADASAAKTTLGLVIGTNVQAYDADLLALAGISGVRGDLLIYGSTGWERLGIGNSGYILTSNGTGADASWQAAPTSGIPAPGSPVQGDILYYNGSAWTNLGYGTNGYFLKTQGASANPVWAEPPGATGGEANTASNLGAGVGVFEQKSSIDLQFNSLVAGTGISISEDDQNNEIDIAADTGTGNGKIPTRPAENALSADTVSEITSAAGVTVDGVLCKDSTIYSYTAVTAHTTTSDISTTEVKGGISTNTGAGGAIVLTLPDAEAGMTVVICLTAAYDVDINPQNGEQILSLTNAAGDAITSDATVGSYVVLVAVSATQWLPLGRSGTWTDAN